MGVHQTLVPLLTVALGVGVFLLGFASARRASSSRGYLVSVAGGIWIARGLIAWADWGADPTQGLLLDAAGLACLLFGLAPGLRGSTTLGSGAGGGRV